MSASSKPSMLVFSLLEATVKEEKEKERKRERERRNSRSPR